MMVNLYIYLVSDKDVYVKINDLVTCIYADSSMDAAV